MADEIAKIQKLVKDLEELRKNLVEKRHKIVSDKVDAIGRGENVDVQSFDNKVLEIDKKILEAESKLNNAKRMLRDPSLLQPREKKSVSNILLGESPSSNVNVGSTGQQTVTVSKDEEKSRMAMMAAILGKVLNKYTMPASIGGGAAIFIIALFIIGGYVATAYYTNVQLPFSTQIRTSTNTFLTQASSTLGVGWCYASNFYLITQPGAVDRICGNVETFTFEEVVTFEATTTSFTSLGLPIDATFVAKLATQDATIENLAVTPVILDSTGKNVLNKGDCNEGSPAGRDFCYLNFQRKPDCLEDVCKLDKSVPEKEILYIWGYVNVTEFNEKNAGVNTARVFPKFDVSYDFSVQSQSRNIVVSRSSSSSVPQPSGSSVGPLQVELEFVENVFSQDRLINQDRRTSMKMVVKNNGEGLARIKSLRIAASYDSSLESITVLDCTGEPLNIELAPSTSFEMAALNGITVPDKRSVSTVCFIELPLPVGESHTITFTPIVSYTYEHKGSLAIEPFPPSTLIDMVQIVSS
jgi:hypothetical protein